ncbi:MAG: response regulator [Desulfovibrio sp.]|uniref:response regulator n=1 Tax=Desulfovibrio sp. 7SRBS1 TaxID=3378064 RepID=UPI003B4139FB
MRILITDDDENHLLLMQSILAPFGDCDCASNGQEAVDAVASLLQEQSTYDLIFLDIMMPVMDGQEALRQIRAKEKEARVEPMQQSKVFMTSALDDADNVWEAHFGGLATGYFVKPIRPSVVVRRLEELELI